jgi:hypothetical protein
MTCTKCGVEKEESNYQKYFHSTQNKWRVRKQCTDCYYKTRLKRKNPELFYSQDPNYKKCKTCNEWKTQDDYYFHSRVTGVRFNECKICQNIKDKQEREDYLEENGGSERISRHPNKYEDKYQKEQTFMVMRILGYTYNEDSGIWTKEGWKEIVNGKIVFPQIKKRKKLGTYESKVTYEIIEKIIELRDKGMSYEKIGDKLDISDSAAFKHYNKWKDILK